MSDQTYDIAVIGAGPGGYVTAIRAAQLGFKTVIVEREHLGGICLNWGCIPTKALLRSAEIYDYAKHAENYGLTVNGSVGFDPSAVVRRSRRVSAQLKGGVGYLLNKSKVDVIWGEATVSGAGQVLVSAPTKSAMQPAAPVPKGALGHGTYTAKHIIVATGARPRVLPGIEPDGTLTWTYFDAMIPPTMPKSLIIIGSGAIGIEFASFYRSLGAEVSIIELLPQILPAEDAEIAGLARKRFEKRGMKIFTGAQATTVRRGPNSVTATIDLGNGKTETVAAERLILAVGVVGNVENLGLEKLGVKMEKD